MISAYYGLLGNVPSESQPIRVMVGDVVQMIIQNRVALNGKCENVRELLIAHILQISLIFALAIFSILGISTATASGCSDMGQDCKNLDTMQHQQKQTNRLHNDHSSSIVFSPAGTMKLSTAPS